MGNLKTAFFLLFHSSLRGRRPRTPFGLIVISKPDSFSMGQVRFDYLLCLFSHSMAQLAWMAAPW